MKAITATLMLAIMVLSPRPAMAQTPSVDAIYDSLLRSLAPRNVALISPAASATGVSVTPTLSWSADWIDSVQVLLDRNSTPNTVVGTVKRGTSFTIDAPLQASTKYYWRIKVTNTAGTVTSPTRTFTTGSVVVPPPLPPPTNGDSVAVFDNMDGPRLNPTGEPLYQTYTGNGSQQTVVHYPSSTDPGLLIRIDGTGASDWQDLYWHFFPRTSSGYPWPDSFLQTYSQTPGRDWTQENRWSFWFVPSVSIPMMSMNAGTYVKAHDYADIAQQGGHWYHGFTFNAYAGRKHTVIMNRTPMHYVGADSNTNWPEDPQWAVTDHPYGHVHYLDGMTRFYVSMFNDSTRYQPAPQHLPVGSTWLFGGLRTGVALNEDDARIYSAVGVYNGAAYELHFNGEKNIDRVYEVRYSTTSVKGTAGGFLTGTDGGTVRNPGSGYNDVHWTSPAMAEVQTLYVQVRIQGDAKFSEFAIEK